MTNVILSPVVLNLEKAKEEEICISVDFSPNFLDVQEGGPDYVLNDKDTIVFISTLHGG